MYFQVHQPWRLRKYNVFDIGRKHDYIDEDENKKVLQRVAKKCYLPANSILLDLIKKHKGRFSVAFSLTGVLVEQLRKYAPEALESFVNLAKTGNVEFLAETYYHSMSFMNSKEEFEEQVRLHNRMVSKEFRQRPSIFRNTELIYSNDIAGMVHKLGYAGILAEGADKLLGWQSPNYIYNAKTGHLRVLLKNHKLSDDIAFRFSQKSWDEWPLTASKYAGWLKSAGGHGDLINLFMDYETFGEHHWEDTGIMDFLRHLPEEAISMGGEFITPTQALQLFEPGKSLDVGEPVSWADLERDLSAWHGNNMQKQAFEQHARMESSVKAANDQSILDDWRMLSISDHFYYMSTKHSHDGDVHSYFNPYDSPYEAFIAYMNVLNDLAHRMNCKHRVCETPAAMLAD